VTISVTSFIDDLGPLRSVQAIFVWKIGFDAACVLEYDLEIDERVEIVNARFQNRVIRFVSIFVQHVVNVVRDNVLYIVYIVRKQRNVNYAICVLRATRHNSHMNPYFLFAAIHDLNRPDFLCPTS